MQQHTGQHVLSAAFDRVFKVRTESFHMGADYSTIDLAREVSAGEIARAEDEANRVVWEDRPIHIRFATADEAQSLGLRKESKRDGTLRLIDIDGFDLSACGGTHVARTGAIGIIAVSATEKVRGGSRVTFLAGGRALAGFRRLRDAVAGSIRSLSVLPSELPAAIERVQSEARDLRKQVKDLQAKAAVQEANALVATAEDVTGGKAVFAALAGWDAGGLKTIASQVALTPGHAVILVSDAAPLALVVARAPDMRTDAGQLLRQLLDRHGGKGGGRPEFAQGGGLTSSATDVLQSARELMRV
jgi:alanyl-tRNA synthetase